MKRKRIYTIVAVVAAISVLTITAFAASPSNEGYEEFKALLQTDKDYSEYGSRTVTGELEVIDNGETKLNLSGTINGDLDRKAMNGDFVLAIEDFEKSLEMYSMDNMFYMVDVENNDVYVKEQSKEYDNAYDYKDGRRQPFTAAQESLIDYVMGDLKDDFELTTNQDDSKNIAFELTKDEIPIALNLLLSAADDEKYEEREDYLGEFDYPLFKELSEVDFEHTNIVENIELEYVKISVDIDENDLLKGYTFSATLTGDDEKGEFHKLSINAALEVSDEKDVSIEGINLDGKNVIELPEMEMETRMQHERGMKGKR